MSELNDPKFLLDLPEGTMLAFESLTYIHVEKINGAWTVIGIDDENWDMDNTIGSEELARQDALHRLEKID